MKPYIFKKTLSPPLFFLVFYLLFLLLFPSCIYEEQKATDKAQLCWNDINFKKIEKILKTSEIVKKSIFHAHAKKHKSLYQISFNNGIRAIFKPNRSTLDQVSALRAYYLSQLLNLKLVPPTVIRTIDGESGIVQLFIESNSGNLRDPFNSFQKGDIYLFYTILGELDPAMGNVLIGKNCKIPALIDNEKNIAGLSVIQRGDFPYVLIRGLLSDKLISNLTFHYDNFPFYRVKSVKKISSLRNNLELKKRMPDIKLETFTLLYESIIEKSLYNDTYYFVTWMNTFWQKNNYNKFSYLYKNFSYFTPSKQTVKKFKSLNRGNLHFLSFLVTRSFTKKDRLEIRKAVKPYDDFFLYRRDRILRQYEKSFE